MSLLDKLRELGISENLIKEIEKFRLQYPVDKEYESRIPVPTQFYYGSDVWEQAITAVLCGENLLLVGEKATKLMDDDELLFVDMLSENATMVMRSKKEMFLRIDCGTIPEKKKAAVGVRGMRLDREDELTDIYLLNDQEEKEVEVKGKQVALHRLHIANRDTKGVKK